LQVVSQHILTEIKVQKNTSSRIQNFLLEGLFYKQIDGVAVASPLAPRVANVFMEKFEQEGLRTVKKKTTHRYRCVDGTIVISNKSATISQVYHLIIMYSSTCFGRPHAHHQELNNCSNSTATTTLQR
jgi:hypothetical protein